MGDSGVAKPSAIDAERGRTVVLQDEGEAIADERRILLADIEVEVGCERADSDRRGVIGAGADIRAAVGQLQGGPGQRGSAVHC